MFGRNSCPVAAAALALLTSMPSRADDEYLLVGPSIAYVSGAGTGGVAAPGVDLTYAIADMSSCSQCIGPSSFSVFWASIGVRDVLTDPNILVPYVEAGTWFLLTLGAGYSAAVDTDLLAQHNLHLFLGAPFPVFGSGGDKKGMIVEPYYRPMWQLSGGDAVHELGALLKFSMGL